jgi:hypothetical protein
MGAVKKALLTRRFINKKVYDNYRMIFEKGIYTGTCSWWFQTLYFVEKIVFIIDVYPTTRNKNGT